jgi:hypothetical protein
LVSGIKQHVVHTTGQPDHGIVLCGWHGEVVRPNDRLVESMESRWCLVGRHRPPQFGPETGYQIDAADRRPWFAQRSDGRNQFAGFLAIRHIPLEVHMGGRSQTEYAALTRFHSLFPVIV